MVAYRLGTTPRAPGGKSAIVRTPAPSFGQIIGDTYEASRDKSGRRPQYE